MSIDSPYDVNRDRCVDAADLILARNNATSPLSALRLITPDPDAVVVVGQYLLYNDSPFDGADQRANELDDAAIATDKIALLPGNTASFDNYSSYPAGINGIMIDIDDFAQPAGFSLTDFRFRVGNVDEPETWTAGPLPLYGTIRPDAGIDGSDRVTLVWANGVIRNTWLEVTVLAGENTGLIEDHVFYFGSAVGEVTGGVRDLRSGGAAGSGDPRLALEGARLALVNAADLIAIRDNPRGAANPAGVDCPFDVNRDMRVDAVDLILARNNATSPLAALRLIAPGGVEPVAGGEAEGRCPPARGGCLGENDDFGTIAAAQRRCDADRDEGSSRLSGDSRWWDGL